MRVHKLFPIDKVGILLFFTAVLQVAGLTVFAQQQTGLELQKYIPLSPNAAELGKYGTYPVGTITGTPEISFNLFTVNSGELSLPVTLSYHASGIKVNQMATWAGLGWSVNAGGMISRSVYGMVDEKSYGFMDSTQTHPRVSELRENTNYDPLYAKIAVSGDMEPDLFAYSVGNKSGKFIYTRNRNFLTIPYTPVKIRFSGQIGTSGGIFFEITDDDGTTYQFNDVEYLNVDAGQQHNTYVSTWYLTRIVSASRQDTIAFTYQLNSIESYTRSYSVTVGQTFDGCLGQGVVQSATTTYRQELQPSEITFRGGKLVFSASSNRKDGGGKQLDKIVQYAKNADGTYAFVRQVNLLHSNFLSTPFYENRDCYKLKLDGFNFADASGNIEKAYQFGYNSQPMPQYNSNSQDYFGFYNGKNNTSLIPVTTLVRNELSSDFMSGTGGNAGFCSVPMTLGDADRNPDPEYMKAGMLEKIIYPTKGFTVFEFEPHAYLLKGYPVEQVRYATVPRLYGAGSTMQESKVAFTPSIHASTLAKISINFSATSPNPIDEPQQVTLRDLTTGQSTIWRHTGNLTSAQTIVNAELPLSLEHSYELVVNVQAPTSTYADASLEWYETVQQDLQKQGGGLRVSRIRNYNSDSTLANEESYTYGELEDGMGAPIFDYDFFFQSYVDAMEERAYYSVGQGTGGVPMCEPQRRFFRTYQGVADNTSITYMGSPVLYPKVIKYNGNASNNAGKTAYYYEVYKTGNFVPHTFMSSGNYGSLDNAWYQGNLVKETTFKNTSNTYLPVSEKNYVYGQFNIKQEFGVALRRYCTGDVNCGSTATANGMMYYTFYEYPIQTGVNKLISEETIYYDQFDTSKTLRNSKTYAYDNTVHFYPAETNGTDSKGQTVKEQVKYTFDVAGSDAVLNRMVANNMLAVPAESYRYVNSNLVYTEKNTFQSWNGLNNLIRPLKKEVFYGGGTTPVSIEYRAYDSVGNVNEQAKANDASEVYLWGYNNQYPVVKVVGSRYDTVAALVNRNLLQRPPGDQQLRTELDKLRTALSGKALVTTYTYKPLVGMTSETDATGKTTYYEYDAFGRLKLIRDKDQQIIKTFDYRYDEQAP
ncbi:MAG TPA: RHS repeat domain-containing protein [Chitinophaga sp.]